MTDLFGHVRARRPRRGLPRPKCNHVVVIGVDLSSQPDQAVEVEWQDGRILSVREAPRG